MGGGLRRLLAGGIASLICAAGAGGAAAQDQLPQGTDYGGFRNVLPGGQGETVNAFELAQSELSGDPPATFVNQLPMYTDILKASPNLQPADLDKYFKSARFGVADGDAARTYSPRPGVTVIRDRLGVPHVYGQTSRDVAFGAGYVSAEDRLFLMDVLRHTGRARLTELIGAGENDSTLRMDAQQLMVADYSEEELEAILENATAAAGEEGRRMRDDFEQYAAGINQYIAEARSDSSKMPVEYQALSRPQGAADWKPTDSVAVASLIGGIFGKGGGREADASQVLLAAQQRFGERGGRRVFRDFRAENDPEHPFTTSRRFPFDRPSRGRGQGVALPDLGSIQPRNPVIAGGGSGGGSGAGAQGPAWLEELQRRGLVFPKRQSNVLLVNSRRSKSGKAFAIMGPQVDYYSPQILMEMDLHGGGYDARGATFPGISLYVLLGRGQDFSWSATTATTDVVDQFVERLCNPDGSPPTRDSTHYMWKGACVPFKQRDYTVTTPVAATDPSAAPRQVTFRALRSVHGPIQATATVGGAPVAIASARSTFFHELESSLAFKRLNFNEVRSARTFQDAVSNINFAFNWFYADDRDIAYLQSGWYPRRARGTDPSLPAWGTGEYDWVRFKPDGYKTRRMPVSALPKAINPASGYIVNWNNGQAPGWRSADDVWSYGPVHRSQILEKPLQRTLRREGRTDLTRLTQINIEGATVDLRGQEVLPLMLRVIGSTGEGPLRPLAELLDTWRRTGAHRRDLDGDNVYDHSPAVALFDEWWDRWLTGAFQPVLGQALMERIRSINPFSQMPPPGGSTWFDGWQGYASKDLRRLLRKRVRGPLSRAYCGRGSRARCRAMLLATLSEAAARVREKYGVSDLAAVKVPATCGSPRTCDQIEFTTAGAVATPPIHWQNRPTFQQIVEPQGHRPR
ncbi:MAG: penicillin acylase family protein [Actinomycetota bacterium]|nr:penicillin acylase family protein [Actinomycetota bacterium]